MARVKGMPCISCELMGVRQNMPTDVHHIREHGTARNDFLTLPLCWHCHQGSGGVHGTKDYLRILKMSEVDLLALVIERMSNSRIPA